MSEAENFTKISRQKRRDKRKISRKCRGAALMFPLESGGKGADLEAVPGKGMGLGAWAIPKTVLELLLGPS